MSTTTTTDAFQFFQTRNSCIPHRNYDNNNKKKNACCYNSRNGNGSGNNNSYESSKQTTIRMNRQEYTICARKEQSYKKKSTIVSDNMILLSKQPKPWLATTMVHRNKNNNNSNCSVGNNSNGGLSRLMSCTALLCLFQFTAPPIIITATTAIIQQTQPLSTTIVPMIGSAWASSYYGTLSDEQKVVAEAWRLIDNSFLDRTFNGLDWFQIREKYVKKTTYKDPIDVQNAVTEMTSLLGDKYTRYLSPAKYQSIVTSATGETIIGGTGMEISQNKQTHVLFVSDIVKNSPADKAGIRIGDVFVEVDGTRFINDPIATPDDVGAKLRGPKGSRVGVVMERNMDRSGGSSSIDDEVISTVATKKELIDVILVREPITITSVQSYMSSYPSIGKVGIVRIKNFSGTTAQTVSDMYQTLKRDGAQAFVIDVRGNPGGLLPGGVDTASLFLDSNQPVVYVVNKNGIVDTQTTLQTGIDIDTPIVVLVDSNTASAAEVFTAALKENYRALVVGETTFGKGIVQTIRDLDNGTYGGIAITVARYETPLHHNINLQGIPVDRVTSVTCPKDDAIQCLLSSSTTKTDSKQALMFQKPSTIHDMKQEDVNSSKEPIM